MKCPACADGTRRHFLGTAALGTAAVAAAAKLPKKLTDEPETLVTTFYKSLSPEQSAKMAFPFDHPLRSKVDNNWFITPARVGKFFLRKFPALKPLSFQ